MSRLRRQDGFTLVELMMTLLLGMIVILSALAVVDRATRTNRDVELRNEAVQEGRRGFDRIVSRLHSQVCTGDLTQSSASRPFTEATATKATFYADFSDASPTKIPSRYTISLNTTTGDLTETVVPGGGTATSPTYSGTGTTRLLAERITQLPGTPLFQYYAYTNTNPATATTPLNSNAAPAVASANLASIARIVITGRAAPASNLTSRLNTLGTSLQDEVYVRLADPNENPTTPQCS